MRFYRSQRSNFPQPQSILFLNLPSIILIMNLHFFLNIPKLILKLTRISINDYLFLQMEWT